MILEKEIEAAAKRYAEKCGVLFWKFTSPGRVGVPDRILIGPFGRIAFVEFKRQGKRPTDLQRFILKTLSERGVIATYVDSLDGAKKVIDELCT